MGNQRGLANRAVKRVEKNSQKQILKEICQKTFLFLCRGQGATPQNEISNIN